MLKRSVVLSIVVLALLAGCTEKSAQRDSVAADFSLQDMSGKTVRLSDYKGKKAVVLAWFPKAYTSGCTIECKSLAENGDKIRKFNVAYFMASVDAVEDNKGFAEKEKADFPLLSDPTKATATAYGVLSPGGLARHGGA